MAPQKQQKSILAFFKSPPSKPVDTTSKLSSNGIKQSVDKASTPPKVADEVDKIENGKTESLDDSVISVESKNGEKDSPMDVTKEDSAEMESPPIVEIIPRRKTARKQMGGAKKWLNAPANTKSPKKKTSSNTSVANNIQNIDKFTVKTVEEVSCPSSSGDEPAQNEKISVPDAKITDEKKAATHSLSSSEEEVDEIVHLTKKRKRSSIGDDSPVKGPFKRKSRVIESDSDDVDADVNPPKSKPLKEENEHSSDEEKAAKGDVKELTEELNEDKSKCKKSEKAKGRFGKVENEGKAKKIKTEKNEIDVELKPAKKGNRKTVSSSEEDDCKSSKTKVKKKPKAEEIDVNKVNTKTSKVLKKKVISSSEEDSNEAAAESTPEEPKVASKQASFSDFFKPKGKEKVEDQTKDDAKIKKDDTKKPSEKGIDIYNPAKPKYHPIDDACWRKGEKVPYLALARTLEEIEKITARLRIVEILANFFRSVIVLTPDDLLHSVYLCSNRLAPDYEGIELGVGDTLMMKAVAQATGRTIEKIKADIAVEGDLALVAESSRGTQRVMFAFPKLTVSSVFAKFKEIALMSGNSVMAKKTEKILALFSACRFSEARYIIRSLGGKLRIGLAEQSVLAALAQAAVLTPPNQSYPPEVLCAYKNITTDEVKEILTNQTLILKSAYSECPNYDIVIPILLKEGIKNLPKHCHLKPGIPLKPMLAHPTKGVQEVLKRFDENKFTCEFKYDGERAQIHYIGDNKIKIYSRNQEDNTSKYPDIISRLASSLKPDTKSFILDSEVVAWDREAEEILPFQILSTRKRKDASSAEIKVQVCVVAFDLLYLNGEALIKKPLIERRELLRNAFNEIKSEFMYAQSMDGDSAEVMQQFLEESIKGKCEGLMVKSLEIDATYEIAKRSHNWLKLKKDYQVTGGGDSLDLIVIGGWYGKGKRKGNYGGFLLACYDEDTDEYQTICKIGTGFKDNDLEAHDIFFKQHVLTKPRPYYRYDPSLEPDVWFDAVQVWEVKCADLSISPVHKAAAGIVDPVKGISLRFPRFIRIRDDKKIEDGTSSTQVAEMYKSQDQVKDLKPQFDEEDFY